MNAHQLFLYQAASRSGPLTLTFYLGERTGDDIALRVEVRAPSWSVSTPSAHLPLRVATILRPSMANTYFIEIGTASSRAARRMCCTHGTPSLSLLDMKATERRPHLYRHAYHLYFQWHTLPSGTRVRPAFGGSFRRCGQPFPTRLSATGPYPILVSDKVAITRKGDALSPVHETAGLRSGST